MGELKHVMEVPREVERSISHAAQLLGVNKSDVIERAIKLYLDNLEGHLHLRKEMRLWDKISDEALAQFEQRL